MVSFKEFVSAYENVEINETKDLVCMEFPCNGLTHIIIFLKGYNKYQTLIFAIARTDSSKPFSENVISEKQVQDGEEIECASLDFSKEELLTLFKRF